VALRSGTISIVVPALNEERNIVGTVEEIRKALGDRFEQYEILLFDDGSSDRTGELMQELATGDPHIRVTRNVTPRNLGGVYKQGIETARYDYLMLVPGDNEIPAAAIQRPLDYMGESEIIIPYPTNTKVRSPFRRLASRGYTTVINILFGQNLKYYNGTVVSRTADLRKISITTDSFAYQSEALLKLLRSGRSYTEVPIEIRQWPGRRSNALRLRNLLAVFRAIGHLVLELHWRSREQARGSGG
jgi:dolichol-phosphate mannosyltransferase